MTSTALDRRPAGAWMLSPSLARPRAQIWACYRRGRDAGLAHRDDSEGSSNREIEPIGSAALAQRAGPVKRYEAWSVLRAALPVAPSQLRN